MSKLKIKKANRVLTIDKHDLEKRLEEGYDLIDDDGKVIQLATGGRTVSLPEYNKVLDELEALKKSQSEDVELNKLQDAFQNLANENDKLKLEFEELKKENTSLKSKLTKTESALEAAKETNK